MTPDPGPGAPGAGAVRQVPCPSCRGPAAIHSSNRWRPFCSERCRQVDLGAWASEQFRVAGEPAVDGADVAADGSAGRGAGSRSGPG